MENAIPKSEHALGHRILKFEGSDHCVVRRAHFVNLCFKVACVFFCLIYLNNDVFIVFYFTVKLSRRVGVSFIASVMSNARRLW